VCVCACVCARAHVCVCVCVCVYTHACVRLYLRGLPPPGSLFLVPGRSPKSCIIQTRSVENDMLCRRAVGRIPHCLASATNILFSAISHGVRTDGELLVDDLLTFVVMLSSKSLSFIKLVSSSPSAGVQSKSFCNQNKDYKNSYITHYWSFQDHSMVRFHVLLNIILNITLVSDFNYGF